MKKLFLLAITAILSLNLFCQVHWTKYPDNPVLIPGSTGEWDENSVGASKVIYYDNTYHMWYNGTTNTDTTRIGHATSPDGITWAKDTNNPVLDMGPQGAWDDVSVYTGGVLVIDSIFHVWYTGWNGTDVNIGHASSPDGINWTKDTNNPVLGVGPEGAWDDGNVFKGMVLVIDSIFHMWYTGWDGTDDNTLTGHATSPDGVTWTKDPHNPVLTAGDWDSPMCKTGGIIFDGSTYHMWYEGGPNKRVKIGYATSEDGWQWNKYGKPVLYPSATGWESGEVDEASVLFDSTEYKYKMWYTARGGVNIRFIGYAESDTCSDIIIPELIAEDTLYQPDYIDVTSSENGIIYLLPYGSYYTLDAIREACIDSVEAIANTPVPIPLADQPNEIYRLLARDHSNNVSNYHQFTILGVGTLESSVKSSVSIYPNPASAIVNIQTNRSGEYTIVVEALNGKEISSGRFIGNTHQIDLSSFRKGVYLITIKSKDFVTTRKIIKL